MNSLAQIAVLKVVPENTPVQHTVEKGKFLNRMVQRLLEDLAVYLLLELAAQSEYSGIGSSCGGRNYLRCIIQLILVSFSISCHYIYSLSLNIYQSFSSRSVTMSMLPLLMRNTTSSREMNFLFLMNLRYLGVNLILMPLGSMPEFTLS